MKIVLGLIFLIFSGVVKADCIQKARQNGDGYSELNLVLECFDEVKPIAKKVVSNNNEIKLYGHENLLLLEFSDSLKYQVRPNQKRIAIAGSEIGFDIFEDGIILDKRKQILVLSDKKLSVFRMNVGGNVAPLFYLESEELESAESVELNNDGNLVINYKGSSVKKIFQLEKKKISFLAEVE